MQNKKLKYVLISIIIILFIALFICLFNLYNSMKDNNEVKTLSTIEGYNYTLNDNDSPYFKELFEELQNCLTEEEIDNEVYATLVSKLFVTDFYSLEYAMSKSDIGGIQFIYSDNLESFKLKAKDTIYNYVESNIYGKREQELPNITNVEVVNIKEDIYDEWEIDEVNAYYVDLSVTYENDLGYPTEVSMILVPHNDKLEIVKVD